MTNVEWVVTSVALLMAVTLVFVVLALAYSPEPLEDSPYV